MAESDRVAQARAIEAELEGLRGVRGARVELTPAGVKSIRVLVVPERSTAETVRDVQHSVMQRTGGTVEAARVQVLRTSESLGPAHRRKLSSVLTERSGNRFTARVTLELAGDILVGESDAPSGPRFEYRSMARATLDGIGDLIEFPLEVQGVFILTEGEERFAVVLVTRGHDALVGSAVVRTDEYDAIARATLDAVNRFVARPEEEEEHEESSAAS